jgi:protein gp37
VSAQSSIEWLMGGATWNPLRARNLATGKVGWFCEHKSALCTNCYAERMNLWIGNGLAYEPVNRSKVEVLLDERILTEPLRWRRPRLIFPGSMTDLFADWVTDEMLDRIFAVMALAPRHTFLVLTKRPERAARYLTRWPNGMGRGHHIAWRIGDGKGPTVELPLPNVWLGYSGADKDGVEALLKAPAAIHWLSIEPLLGPVEIERFLHDSDCMCGVPGMHCVCSEPRETCVDWVVTGAESGSGARPMNLDWVRSLRDQCADARVPFFFKQDALNGRKIPTPELDGRRWVEMPRPA